jgi:glutamate-ammonia-ligase adenylyltransferase
LSDVEWTVQLLQLEHGIAAPGTIAALEALEAAGVLDPVDAVTLAEAYRFCERTRNRLWLVRGGPSDALPTDPGTLSTLARSLDTNPVQLRDHYRRVTRRCRSVMERLFYGRNDS